MPIETLEAPIETSVTTIPKPTQELGGIRADISKFLPDRVRNEFNNTNVEPFKPKPITIEGKDELAEEFNRTLEGDFAYYSRTRDLEVNTDRTRMIQGVVDKLAAGSDIETRVVIMRRGREPNAFVVPDGTIFISQSLINRLDSLDEVAAVLAHELGHLINKTSITTYEAGPGRFGVGWMHETACDLKAHELLEKAGFKSWAFATAIEKVQGMERGVIHQSGLSRASQSVGSHLAVDRSTSSQQEIPIPKELKGRFSRTNLEIIMDKIEERKSIQDLIWKGGRYEIEGARKNFHEKFISPIKPILEQLHPRDFGAAYRHLVAERRRNNQVRSDMRECDEVIRTQLEKQGYSRAEINLFLVRCLGKSSSSGQEERDAYMFKTVEDLTEAVDTLVKYDIDQGTTEMYEFLFDSQASLYSTADQLLKSMGDSVYDVNFEQLKEGTPVTRDTLFNSLEKISKIDDLSVASVDPHIITRYIARTFLALSAEAGSEIDEAQIREFFQDIKDRGIKVDPYSLILRLEEMHFYVKRGVNISAENKQAVVDAAKAVFEREPFVLTTEEIDKFFGEFNKDELIDNQKGELLKTFLNQASNYFEREKVSDEQRLYFAKYLAGKIDGVTFQSRVPWLETFEERYSYGSGRRTVATEEDLGSNDAILKFNLNMFVGITFFKQDSDQFYEFIGSAMDKMNPYTSNLSRRQLINLCQPLFLSHQSESSPQPYYLGRKGASTLIFPSEVIINILDHDRFINLPMVKRIMDLEENINFVNLRELNQYTSLELSSLFFEREDKPSLYGDKLIALCFGRNIRDNFEKLLKRGIDDQDFGELYVFLSNYYPDGPQKDQFLRELNKHYLRSPNVVFDKKVDYMILHFNRVGPEAMVILADQIQDVETYRLFRERLGIRLNTYLEGQELMAANVVAGVDFLSSFFVKEFEKLLMTCQDDPQVSKKVSSELAAAWFGKVLNSRSGIEYNTNLKKFVLTAVGRTTFRTLADSFSTVKGFSDLQKFAIIHKSLTDTKGAFTSLGNRKKLASLLTKSLGMEKGFVASVLSAACTEADAKLIGIPASMMLIPLVFRSLDVKEVDLAQLLKTQIWHGNKHVKLEDILSKQAISDILQADTRSVSVFGASYQNQPSSQAAQLAEESNRQFTSATDHLNNLLRTNGSVNQERQRGLEIDPSLEAAIKGVETSGALGIKALQLAAQFETLPPPIERRLSETFDSNPGMEKLRFWENLNKLAIDASVKGDQEIEQYLQRVTLGNYVGGGSLQTTYAATLDIGTPNETQVVIKMRNPNVDQFILESYDSATKSLDYVAGQRGAGKSKQHAQTGRVLMDLAQKWCLDDLNDTTYIERDDLFRQTIEQFNIAQGRQLFYAPQREFTSLKLKSETLSPGQTFNQFLNNPEVDSARKKEAVETLTRFFIHQLKGQPFEDSEGKYHLVHSDPHVGNYIVDATGPDTKFGVIDRSMYLKLSEKDIKVLEKLVLPGNDNYFVYGFIDRVLDTNKVRGVQRAVVTGNVLAPVYLEYRRQQARGNINKLDLMRTMFQALADARVYAPFNARRLDVPLNLRLMIRNIGAFQELGRRYGVDFEALYREAA